MKEINKKLEDALANYFFEANDDDIQEYIDSEVLDKESYLQKKEKHLRRINFLAKALINKQKDENLLKLVAEKLHSGLLNNIDRPVAYLKEILQNKDVPAYYSKLDKISKEDIIEIIKDRNLIEILEKLEGDGEKH